MLKKIAFSIPRVMGMVQRMTQTVTKTLQKEAELSYNDSYLAV